MKDKEDEKAFRLRLPPELFIRLEWIANKEGRSINRQITKWLEEAVEKWENDNPKNCRLPEIETQQAA